MLGYRGQHGREPAETRVTLGDDVDLGPGKETVGLLVRHHAVGAIAAREAIPLVLRSSAAAVEIQVARAQLRERFLNGGEVGHVASTRRLVRQ